MINLIQPDRFSVPWTPLDLSPILWLDASDTTTITSSGGLVSQWADKSTDARHATQIADAKKPTTGAATKNGLNVLRFDGDNLSFSTIAGTALTMFYVIKKDAEWDHRFLFNSTDFNSYIYVQGHPVSAGSINSRRYWPGPDVSSPTFAVNTWAIGRLISATGTTGVLTMGLNGADSSAGNQPANQWNLSYIGYYSTTDDEYRGYIAEVLAFGSTLGVSDLAAVESYLNTKWAVY